MDGCGPIGLLYPTIPRLHALSSSFRGFVCAASVGSASRGAGCPPRRRGVGRPGAPSNIEALAAMLTEVAREGLADWEQGGAQPPCPIAACALRPVRTSARSEPRFREGRGRIAVRPVQPSIASYSPELQETVSMYCQYTCRKEGYHKRAPTTPRSLRPPGTRCTPS